MRSPSRLGSVSTQPLRPTHARPTSSKTTSADRGRLFRSIARVRGWETHFSLSLYMCDAPIGVRTCCCCRRQRPRAPKTCLSPAPENCAIFDRRRTPRRRAPSLFLRSRWVVGNRSVRARAKVISLR
jgi:hypothetical protein